MTAFQPPAPAAQAPDCDLCREAGGTLVFQAPRWRVIRADEPGFPAFYRVVWRDHVREWTDLAPSAQAELMAAVAAVERVLREALAPAKINLASLGNVTPHLHWHVIARFEWDSHFPGPVWAAARRTVPSPAPADRLALPLAALDARVAHAASACAVAA